MAAPVTDEQQAEAVLFGLSDFRHLAFVTGCLKCGAPLAGEHIYDWDMSPTRDGVFYVHTSCPKCGNLTTRIHVQGRYAAWLK